MMKKLIVAITLLICSSVALAMTEDDPIIYKIMIDELEMVRADDDNHLAWDAELWVGKDIDKLWFSTSGSRQHGETEALSTELRYGRAMSAFWDIQFGWRRDIKPEPAEDWLVAGFKGLAPYLFETDAFLRINEDGLMALDVSGEYEYLLTQRWVLIPEGEITLYNKRDEEAGRGGGLSSLELGLRLAYEVRREVAPYIGIRWEKAFGDTARYLDDAGEDSQESEVVLGVKIWF